MTREFNRDLAFAVGEVEMSDSLRNGQKTMNIVSAGKHRLSDIPRCDTTLLHESNHLRLPLLKRAEVTMEEFFVIANRVAMAAVNERRRTSAQPGQTNEILGE